MGLPQVSPKVTDEVTTALSTFVSTPPRFGGLSTCDLDGLHGGSTNTRIAADFPCSSISDFQRKTSLELPKGTDGPFKCRNATDGAASFQGLKIDSRDTNGWLLPKMGQSVQQPVVRVVGFESNQPGSSVNGFERNAVDGIHPSIAIGGSDPSTDSRGPQVRKRMLSPLNSMLHKQFHGDLLDIACADARIDSSDSFRKHNIFSSHDFKKANFGNADCTEPRDGPLLENKEPFSHYHQLSAWGVDPSKEKRVCRDIAKDIENDFSVLKDGKGSIGGNGTRMLTSSEDNFGTKDTLEETCMLHDEFDTFTPQRISDVGQNWGPESAPTSHCMSQIKSLSMLPVRRSLVGSFEESLLSGRFSSGKVSQRIDGFLAVLNVTGGNFLPPSQKLPFAVTSIDGDSSLLYYASIDLAGSLSSNKCKGPKLRRSLSNDDSRAVNSRLRIPMKGCIQLVLGSSVNGFERNAVDGIHPSIAIGGSDPSTDSRGPQVRKRMLSPLNSMLHKQFHGDLLDIACADARIDSSDSFRKHNIFSSHDFKKANFGNADCTEPRDGPLLENKEPFSHYHQLSAWGVDPSKEKRVCRDIAKDIENDFSVLKDGKGSIGGNGTRMLTSSEDNFATKDTLEETCMLHDEFDTFTPQRISDIGQNWGPESAPTSHCMSQIKSLSMLPVRRSLVGSFEESLLSGRFSSGKVSQRIDGFLAVLNVTGGNFLPPSQKLPFAVTSIDGDSSLLYYASIDLAGSLSSNKCKGPKLRRSLSNDDSRAVNSRLRIPMKGCIQLVLGFLAFKN
ncbi:hypothetical protein COCNU_02G009340 [Cocos nucifera]|uniref:Atos-like conserved domain-containing protein n=1 Tax=Cocos nucifera TaxID=13894 RepID=A0A8K0MWS8_COCNU|nr:hypothetical protein COCNU_02G009340 [Cocos nucifera]